MIGFFEVGIVSWLVRPHRPKTHEGIFGDRAGYSCLLTLGSRELSKTKPNNGISEFQDQEHIGWIF